MHQTEMIVRKFKSTLPVVIGYAHSIIPGFAVRSRVTGFAFLPPPTLITRSLIRFGPFTTLSFAPTGDPLDQGPHSVPVTEMMTNGSPVGANERVVNGPKRISDRVINVGGGRNANPVTLLRTANPGIIE